MSQQLEESPVSDNKMDISETTTSQDSPPGFASDVEECTGNATEIIGARAVSCEQIIYPTNDKISNEYNDNPNITTVAPKSEQRNPTSGLTPVSNHPLMLASPTGSDSDISEITNSNRNHDKPQKHNYYHFPDVVPVSELPPLRLANPHPKQKQLTGTGQTTGTARRLTSSNTNASSRRPTSTLDVINNIDNTNDLKKSSLLRDSSPDFLSSGSEPELSLFHASVGPAFQSVALGQSQSNSQLQQNLHHKSISPRLHQRRKLTLHGDLMVDDISSLEETVSNHSVDDLQQNLVSLSPSSSILDDNGFNVEIDEDFLDVPGTPKNDAGGSASLPQYSARDEARDIRNWQKITLPDGKTHEIDMKVIEPYKCVLSHGGYLQSGGHNAIVVFSACHLPDRSRADYHYVMNNLFLYVVKTLEQLVTEDYVLVYLHGGSNRNNVPPFPWLKKCYQLLDRRLRKSLKTMYMVHPTFWLKSVVWMARPFLSSKFWRKLIYVKTLEELYNLVPVERAAVPDKVKNYDSRHS
ncbi:caytaxin [Uranotaenia lowii]|uniref:caytaxin n=1 Tax=Uranotaenia lowii TaxID=190385 RepID=UPI0024792255|nr:caytaxin [Uranotaenia lowii]